MNRYMKEKWSWIEGSHFMHTELLDALNNSDLAFNPGGQNMTLGALCREIGEIVYSYIQSFILAIITTLAYALHAKYYPLLHAFLPVNQPDRSTKLAVVCFSGSD